MSLNSTPSGERVHISFFGLRNAGKSALINAVTGQELAVVSDVPGTTTDPVSKAMELLPLGPVMMTDTPGIDDFGGLGELRVKKTKQTLNRTDIAVLVTEREALAPDEEELIALFKAKGIPYITAHTKHDSGSPVPEREGEIWVSAKTGYNIGALKDMLGRMAPKDEDRPIIRDMLDRGDTVVLVVPIDASAPKGRLILPQQQTIRDILDVGAAAYVTAIDRLKDGDTVLISEGCTHHRQCEDIGTVKIPNMLRKHTGKRFTVETSSGGGWPEDLSKYAMVIHCGGCMLSPREMKYRMQCAVDAGIPFTNYGITLAYLTGVLRRSISPFPGLLEDYDRLLGK